MTPEPVIPISAIEHFVYCPRQCALIHCDGVWSDNVHTVYVRNHRARIQHRRGSLTVSSPEGNQRIPLEALDAIVVLGGAQVTMDACVRRGVRVAALNRGGAIRFLVSGATNGNVHLRTALYQSGIG